MIEAVPWSDFIMAIIVWIFFVIIVMILIEYCNMKTLNNLICRIFDHSEKEVQRRQWQSGDKFEITRCSRCHEILNLKSKVE